MGGDILEVTFNNADVGTGSFRPKAGEGNTFDPGGPRNADTKAITSQGKRIVTKNMVPGFFQILLENDFKVNKDIEKLAALAASLNPTTWTISHISGAIYQGEGDVSGDIVGDLDKATVPLRIEADQFFQI